MKMDGTENIKPKTTFEVDSQNLHLDFKDATGRQGSDMTKELNKFMVQYVADFKKSQNLKKEGYVKK